MLPGKGRLRGAVAAEVVELQAVEDHEAAALERVAGHEGLGEVVEAGAVDHDARLADGVDQRAAGGVAPDVDLAALGAVHERLADVAVDDELAGLHDLAELVLRVAVDVHLQPVDAGGLVVAGAVVEVDAHADGVRPEADPVEALPDQVVGDEALPAEAERVDDQLGVAVLQLRLEAVGVDDEGLLPLGRLAQLLAVLPADALVGALGGGLDRWQRVEDLVQRDVQDLQHRGALLRAGVAGRVDQRRQRRDRRLAQRVLGVRRRDQVVAEAAQRVVVPVLELLQRCRGQLGAGPACRCLAMSAAAMSPLGVSCGLLAFGDGLEVVPETVTGTRHRSASAPPAS